MVQRRNECSSGSPATSGAPARARGRHRLRAFEGRVRAAVLGMALVSCAGGAASSNGRYPEEKRPEPPRSASDGEVLGAHEQDPADTLEGSLSSGHAAPRSPHAEEHTEHAHERLEHDECVKANEAAVQAAAEVESRPGAEARKKRICPPAPAPKD